MLFERRLEEIIKVEEIIIENPNVGVMFENGEIIWQIYHVGSAMKQDIFNVIEELIWIVQEIMEDIC